MSIINKRFSAACSVFALFVLLQFASYAQEIEATIKIIPPASVAVEGSIIKKRVATADIHWSFLNDIASAENLSSRISQFNLSDDQNRALSVRRLSGGEFVSSVEASRFSYRINLSPPLIYTSRANVSWLAADEGILMLGDLLPRFAANDQTIAARIKFELPPEWKIISGEKRTGDNDFEVADAEQAVFAAGKNWREHNIQAADTRLNLAVAGEWQLSDGEAVKMSGEIFETYRKMFGEEPVVPLQIFLMRLPKDVQFGRWTAETRGGNVTIVSADMPFKTQSIQRLHEQLRHEIFHLWMPNNLALTGNYDWFYEGFTIYQALRTGVSTNQIRFQDYLNTLAEAYNLDRLQSRNLSLFESSETRQSGANNQVYARGMLAAFLCDLAILRASDGKRSISNVFREVYKKHRFPNEPVGGSAAVLKILKNYVELQPTIEKHIVGREKINWEMDLQSFGIEISEENSAAKLAVKTKLSGKQKHLLDKLGYNNWRKTSGILK